MSDLCRHCRSDARWKASGGDTTRRHMTRRACYDEYYMGSGYWDPDGIHHDINCRNFLSVQDYNRRRAAVAATAAAAVEAPDVEAPISDDDIRTARRVVDQVKRRFKPGHCVECDAHLYQRDKDPRAPVTMDLCQKCRVRLWYPLDVVEYGIPKDDLVWVRGGKRGTPRIWRVVPGVVYGGTPSVIKVRFYTGWPGPERATKTSLIPKDAPRFYRRETLVTQDVA